jgi:hypothetical protein
MHVIKRLDDLTREEVRALAHAAVDRGEPLPEANNFPRVSKQYGWFEAEYRDRQAELSPA